MKRPVIAIGLDSADPLLLEKWMAEGHLKTISTLRQQGAYTRLDNTVNYNGVSAKTCFTERLWAMFSTGCRPDKTGYWGPVTYDASTYGVTHDNVDGGYDYAQYDPFYALGDGYRVATFDLPVSRPCDRVNGLQVISWGGHFPHVRSCSRPDDLLPSIIEKYGPNPIYHKDHGYWWDDAFLERLHQGVKDSVATRVEITKDLLSRDDWDLFLMAFGETHSASHYFWHLSQPDHPLYAYKRDPSQPDPMLDCFEAIDTAIGEIIAAAPKDAYVLVFAVHGMVTNYTDMLSMTFLPEVMYRFSFPGKVALAPGKLGTTPPPPILYPKRRTWAGQVWQQKYESNPIKRFLRPYLPGKFLKTGNTLDLISPYELHEQGAPLNWMPVMWYKPLWGHMKAFAIPAFADGHIRINLQGRDRDGIVSPDEYDALCNEIATVLYDLTDARTGKPVVKEVIRTRSSASDDGIEYPDPDLVVVWHNVPTDVVDSPQLGRIGPITYYRPGGHQEKGFLLAKGEGIAPNSDLSEGQTVDLGPTILELLGAPIPNHLEGHPLVQVPVSSRG